MGGPIWANSVIWINIVSVAGADQHPCRAGITTGEISEKSGPLVNGLMKTLTVGLTDAFLEDLEGQRLAIDGIKAVLREGIAFDAQQPSG